MASFVTFYLFLVNSHLLNRLYKISEPISFEKQRGLKSEIMASTLYKSCDDVLTVIIEVLRILPVPLRQCISVMKERVQHSASALLEWLLSTIFSPLLLQPDDWYLVICNPAKDEVTNNNNIQSIVTTLLQLCRSYQSQCSSNADSKGSSNDSSNGSTPQNEEEKMQKDSESEIAQNVSNPTDSQGTWWYQVVP